MSRRGEAAFQQQVIDYARTCGWRVAHFRPATIRSGRVITPVAADGAGFPDLCMVRCPRKGTPRLVFAELKRRGVRALRPEQKEWALLLGDDRFGEVEHYVWNPIDWPTIEYVLR